MFSDVAAVIVHHRSYESVGGVVESLLLQGLMPNHIVVVDNSEQPSRQAELRKLIPAAVQVLFESNLGYGAAVNVGFDYFCKNAEISPEFFLVSTHEARPALGAVAALADALRERPSAAVAGPTLMSGKDPEFVWSAGGYLKPWSHIPSHHHHREPAAVLDGKSAPETRAWLDGAFLLYRWTDFDQWRMAEQFFLYMEETELHLSLTKSGREVVWVPNAYVWQDSNGIPPFYLARNLRLLFSLHENAARRALVVPLAIGRRVVADIVRRKDFSSVVPALRGLIAPLPTLPRRAQTESRIRVVNPLGAALRHYESEVISVLAAAGRTASVDRIMEPSASGHSPLSWLFRYVKVLWKAKRSADSGTSHTLVLWPVLGYWDVVLLSVLGLRNVHLVVHDPIPLVKAVGYSSWARKCAVWLGQDVGVIAHSVRALNTISAEAPLLKTELLPHPILEPSPAALKPSKIPVVRVVGQYKKDRDLVALAQIAAGLDGLARFEVFGRGWPDVEGWKVVPGFVEEERLSELIAGSAVIVIPYKTFFQSGIAIRSLELGVPAVGPRASVLSEMFTDESELLVEDGASNGWVTAVRHAIENGRDEAAQSAQRWRLVNVSAWSRWLGSRSSTMSEQKW